MKKILTIKYYIVIFLIAIFVQNANANIIYSEADSLEYEKYIESFSQYKNLPENELLLKTAKHFLGKPYVESTLDKSDYEALTINLREFDCTTFVESCIALTKTIKSDNYSFSNFCNILQNMRYRGGKIEDYSSRLHYTSDWMYENEKNGLIKNISKDIGGKLLKKDINFMSSNASAYRQLFKSEELQKKIKKNESQLNNRTGYYVISKEEIRKFGKFMKNGDIVIFSTTIKGLDFTHIGIITTDEKQVTFIHASSLAKKVVIEKKTLNSYCQSSKRCDGIVILRLN